MYTSTKLLRRPRPYPDESLAGYIIRLAENNWYYSPNLIWLLSNLKKRGKYANAFHPKKDDLSQLALLAQVPKDVLWSMTFPVVTQPEGFKENNVNIFGSVTSTSALVSNRVKLCPACLKESAYYRLIWDLAIVTSCPFHHCLLIDRCPQCEQEIKWSRPSIVKCQCQFDWRLLEPEPARSLTLSVHVYKLCQVAGVSAIKSASLPYKHPALEMNLTDLVVFLGSLVKFCRIPYVNDEVFAPLKKAQSYEFNSFCYFDWVFTLFTNWRRDLHLLIEGYKKKFNYRLNHNYSNSLNDVKVLTFFREIFNCFDSDCCVFFQEIFEKCFWNFLSSRKVKELRISFPKWSNLHGVSIPISTLWSLGEQLADDEQLAGLTLARLLTKSLIKLDGEIISLAVQRFPF